MSSEEEEEFTTEEMENTGMDISWADNEEDMIEKEPMTEITCWLLYIDSEGHLRNVYQEKQSLDDMNMDSGENIRKWPRNRLIQFIHSKKQHQGLKYRLMEILLYHMGLEPNQLMETPLQAAKLQDVTLHDEIKIPSSLCIFHEVNCLYFLFQEIPKYEDDEPAVSKPSLRIGDNCSLPRSKQKKTKKVTFSVPAEFRHTKKMMPILEPTTGTQDSSKTT